MRVNQIGFYCPTKDAEQKVKNTFGLHNAEWTKEIITGVSEVRGRKPCRSVYESITNSDIGIEIEIMRCLEGNNWTDDMLPMPHDTFVFSHIGIDLNGEDFPVMHKPWRLIQETFTVEHDGKKLHYRIYDTMGRTFLKITQQKGRSKGIVR